MNEDWRAGSPITDALERTFRYLQYLSPPSWIHGTRPHAQGKEHAVVRGRAIEYFVLVCLAVECICLIALLLVPVFAWPVMLIMSWRVADIFQVCVNVTLFDRLRIKSGTHKVAAHTRIVLLTIWNFFELCFCFGIMYSTSMLPLSRKDDWIDPFYFSAITQLTIGYGDVCPLGPTRIVALIQGMLGFLLAVLVITRVVGALPRIESELDNAA